MHISLAEKECKPCKGMTKPLTGQALDEVASALDGEWEVVEEHHLRREFRFDNFVQALEFTNRVGAIAEEQDHHPEICVTWGKATVTIWTHKIGGLSENDFILAAKINEIA